MVPAAVMGDKDLPLALAHREGICKGGHPFNSPVDHGAGHAHYLHVSEAITGSTNLPSGSDAFLKHIRFNVDAQVQLPLDQVLGLPNTTKRQIDAASMPMAQSPSTNRRTLHGLAFIRQRQAKVIPVIAGAR
jgi:hypothetical protein